MIEVALQVGRGLALVSQRTVRLLDVLIKLKLSSLHLFGGLRIANHGQVDGASLAEAPTRLLIVRVHGEPVRVSRSCALRLWRQVSIPVESQAVDVVATNVVHDLFLLVFVLSLLAFIDHGAVLLQDERFRHLCVHQWDIIIRKDRL